MKSLVKILLTALLITGFNGAFADTQDRHLSGFHAIVLSGQFDVYIAQGASESVKVQAPSSAINRIITVINGDVLNLRDKNEHFNWGSLFGRRNKMAVYVTVRDIRSIVLSGSGDVYFKDGLNANKLELTCSGSGDVSGNLNAKILDAKLSGSGDMKISGRAETSTVSVTGSGDFSGHGLVTAVTMVRASGSGDASVNATQKLDAHVSGSGDIRYTGGAKQVSTSSSGSGEIHRG